MPKFTPKPKKEEERQAPRPPEKKEEPKPSDEELERLRELERKFGKAGGREPPKERKKEEKQPSGGEERVWEKIENSKRGERGKTSDDRERIIQHEAIRHSRPSEGMTGPGDPEYISPEKLEKRKRELAMTEARLRTLEREEQDINKRLEYLRKEHSAMEMAVKEKTYLEREIAELREDRERVQTKLDELKEMEGTLEERTWDELKRSPAIGSRISAMERRIHELEGQIIELNEQRLKAAGVPVETSEPKPAPKPQPKEEKPAPKPESQPQPKQEEKKPPPAGKKKSRLTF